MTNRFVGSLLGGALAASILNAGAASAQRPPTEATAPAAVPPPAGPSPPAPASPVATSTEAESKDEPPSSSNSLWDQIKPSTLWYLSYAVGQEDDEPVNRVHVGRGYVTLKYQPVEWFQPRVTLDTHQDDSGDWTVRLKYLYGKFVAPFESEVLTEPNVEVGMVHTPWFDYEEHINNYRAEGTMFIERNKVLNSADLGVTFGGLLGEKLPQEYQKKVSRKYPGRIGSFAFGVYNGGGYHAAEENENKVFQARISLRPLGFAVPHWQVSYLLIYGDGNTADEPDWRMHDFMTSLEHEYFVLTGQLCTGKGNQKGDQVDADGDAFDLFGFSIFGEIKLPWIQSSLIGRFDRFDWDTDGGPSPTSRVIAGHAFHFLPHNFLLASLDHVTYSDPGIPTDRQVKLTMQIHYPPK